MISIVRNCITQTFNCFVCIGLGYIIYSSDSFSKFSFPIVVVFFTNFLTFRGIAVAALFIPLTANVPFTQHLVLLVLQIKIENKL